MTAMNRYWTIYWTEETRQRNDGGLFSHTGGKGFRKKGILPGDSVYVVSFHEGSILLGGRMIVEKLVSRRKACKLLRTSNLWEDNDHLIGVKQKCTPRNFKRRIPFSLTRRLRFRTKSGIVGLKFRTEGELDNQTLRRTRELTEESARLLDEFIDRFDGESG